MQSDLRGADRDREKGRKKEQKLIGFTIYISVTIFRRYRIRF
jgi:hypothetical protein